MLRIPWRESMLAKTRWSVHLTKAPMPKLSLRKSARNTVGETGSKTKQRAKNQNAKKCKRHQAMALLPRRVCRWQNWSGMWRLKASSWTWFPQSRSCFLKDRYMFFFGAVFLGRHYLRTSQGVLPQDKQRALQHAASRICHIEVQTNAHLTDTLTLIEICREQIFREKHTRQKLLKETLDLKYGWNFVVPDFKVRASNIQPSIAGNLARGHP